MSLFSFLHASPAKIPADLSFIGVDMHNHILPMLDDGSQDLEDSVTFIRQLHALGYHKIICTPHIISDMYPNSVATIEPAFRLLQDKLKEENIPVSIGFAAEFMVNSDFSQLVAENRLLGFGDSYILVEMSYMAASPNIWEIIFDLILQGYQPVLAHPERYGYYHQNFDAFHQFLDAGCLLQVNLLSLTGAYGPRVRKVAERLVKEKLVSFAGTDLHHHRHLAMLTELASNASIVNQLRNLDLKNPGL